MLYHRSALTSLALCVGAAIAQTPNGFEPSVDTPLGVAFGDVEVSAGLELSREQTSSVPTYSIDPSSISSPGPFVIMVVDLDVPIRSGTGVTGRQQLLHQLTRNYALSDNGTLVAPPSEISGGQVNRDYPAPYRGPMPPAENPPRPHRYVELLFPMAEDFDVPSSQEHVVADRVGFNVTQFIAAAGLEDPLAANYFVVTNGTATNATGSGVLTPAPTATETTGAPSGAPSGTGNLTVTETAGLPEYTGAAAAVQVAGAVGGAVAAGVAGWFL